MTARVDLQAPKPGGSLCIFLTLARYPVQHVSVTSLLHNVSSERDSSLFPGFLETRKVGVPEYSPPRDLWWYIDTRALESSGFPLLDHLIGPDAPAHLR